ncbi:hypothetical protein ACLKA6_002033 [Drosophila palustris]
MSDSSSPVRISPASLSRSPIAAAGPSTHTATDGNDLSNMINGSGSGSIIVDDDPAPTPELIKSRFDHYRRLIDELYESDSSDDRRSDDIIASPGAGSSFAQCLEDIVATPSPILSPSPRQQISDKYSDPAASAAQYSVIPSSVSSIDSHSNPDAAGATPAKSVYSELYKGSMNLKKFEVPSRRMETRLSSVKSRNKQLDAARTLSTSPKVTKNLKLLRPSDFESDASSSVPSRANQPPSTTTSTTTTFSSRTAAGRAFSRPSPPPPPSPVTAPAMAAAVEAALANRSPAVSAASTSATPAAASLSNAKKCKPTQIVVRLKPHINQGANALFQSFQMHTPPITEYSVKLGGAGTLRILPKTPDAYRQILDVLRADNSLEYNTYQCRDDRSFRVVVLGIPASLGVSAIRDELTCMGYTVRSVYFPKYKSRSGTGVYTPNFFFLDLAPEPSGKNKEVFSIGTLCKHVVKIEWPNRDPNRLPQCHRCQRFNHTARYCLHDARCVKCGDEHDTRSCQKPDSLPPKCANCGMAHAANYRGCPVLVKLLRLKLSHNNSPSNQLRLQQSKSQQQQKLPKQQSKRPNGQQQQQPKRPNGQQQQSKRPNGQQQHQQQQPKRKQSHPPQQRQQQQQRREQQHLALHGGNVASAVNFASASQPIRNTAAKTIDPRARFAHLERMRQETQLRQGQSLPREAIVQLQQQQLEATFQSSFHKFTVARQQQRQRQQSSDEMSVDGAASVVVARDTQQIERNDFHNDQNDHNALLAAFNRQQKQIDCMIEGMAQMQLTITQLLCQNGGNSADLANA